MSKPWDNELTPMTDVYFTETPNTLTQTADPSTIRDHTRDLERRMRAAERLLDWLVREADTPSQLQRALGLSEAKKHLEAARKDDEQ